MSASHEWRHSRWIANLILATLVSLGGAAGAFAHPPAFVMRPASGVQNLEVFGDGSRDANPADWPSTFVVTGLVADDCTATAVGAQAVLTAAHCVSSEHEGALQIGRHTSAVKCDKYPIYSDGAIAATAVPEADFALCTVSPALPPVSNGFEVISVNADDVRRLDSIELVGFGCRMAGGVDRGFGRLGEGTATVAAVTDDKLLTNGAATLCLGDSGGGAYASRDLSGLRRRLVAVNAVSDLEATSRLYRTSSAAFVDWASKWAAANGPICGLNSAALHCRQ